MVSNAATDEPRLWDWPEVDLATVLHDLRQPLTAIRAHGQLGARSAGGEAEQWRFLEIVAEAERLGGMLDGLLGDLGTEPAAALPVGPLVAEALGGLAAECELAGVAVEAVVEGDAQARLRPALFRRALGNLLSNAVKAMAGGGALTVRVVAAGECVLIAIADTGPGLPPAVQAAAFQPFVTGRPGGTGLGLHQVHQAITAGHGGRVWFETQPGRGTTFYVQVPAARLADDDD